MDKEMTIERSEEEESFELPDIDKKLEATAESSASTASTLDAPSAEETAVQNREIHDKTLSAEAGDPPNGGLKAWLQVAGSFFLFFNSWQVHPVKPSFATTTLLSLRFQRQLTGTS